MPRVFNTAIQGEIDKRFAGEPMVVVEVEWTAGVPTAYSDRKLSGEEYPYPYLISISEFDSTQIVSGGSDSQQVTITLNDVDGTLRTMLDRADPHLNPVRLYLTFQGLNYASRALMFEGVLNSPLVWDEGGRTLTFDSLSVTESVEAGFTMEDGDFPFIDPADRNKPWPLVFGQVCNMQAVQVRGTRKGFLGEGVGAKDPTIEDRLCQAYKLQCPVMKSTVNEDGSTGTQVNDGNSFGNVRQDQPDLACLSRRKNKICEILTEREQQEQYVKAQFIVRDGANFPQGQKITIQINEVRFEGVMNGEVFSVGQVFHPDAEIDNPPCADTPPPNWGYRWGAGSGASDPSTIAGCTSKDEAAYTQQVVGGGGESWEYFNAFKRGNFIWLPPGTEVLLADESEILNIVSLLPGTVDQVAAYRNFSDTSLLTAVDTDLYTVVTTDYGGYDVVEVRMDSPLSTLEDEFGDWDDEIFVSFTSSVGPNPADIIQWLVETYTDLTVDAASFASVKTSLTNYPSNFFVKARPRVLDLMRDVAFQARCAIFIRDNVVYMVYLSKEPTSVKTLTESDILPNSFRITHTGTEELETRHTISWSEGEAGVRKKDETNFEFVLKHNVPKYGIFDAEYDYYTLNIFELVEKSATFWMIRNSNTWKHVEFETPLVHLNLDVFDAVTINTSDLGPIKVVITESRFNLDTNTISFKAWTPIRSGEGSEYLWAWPAAQPCQREHPLTSQSDEAGDGFGLQVIPPLDHPLYGAYDPDTAVLNTDGDKNPSDLCDTFPTVVCKIATGNEISDDVEPEFDPFEPLAEQNFQDRLDDIESGNQNSYSLKDSEGETACGDPGPATRSRSTTSLLPPSRTGVLEAPSRARVVALMLLDPAVAAVLVDRASGLSRLSAIRSVRCSQRPVSKVRRRQRLRHFGTTPNTIAAGNVTGIEGTGPFGECEEAGEGGGGGDPGAPGADAGETQKPKCKAGGCVSCVAECPQSAFSAECADKFPLGGNEYTICVQEAQKACIAQCDEDHGPGAES
jgi:hypothetical protein